MITQTAKPYTVNFDFIRRIAEPRIVAPLGVLKRLGIMLPIVLLGGTIAIATGINIAFGNIQTESAQMLAVLLVAASLTVFLGGIYAIGILLWSAFVTQYVEALDAKNELYEFSRTTEITPSVGESKTLEVAIEDDVVIATLVATPYPAEAKNKVQRATDSKIVDRPDLTHEMEISEAIEQSTYVEMTRVIDELGSQMTAYSLLYESKSRKSWWFKIFVATARRDVIFENVDKLVNQLIISTKTGKYSPRNRQEQV